MRACVRQIRDAVQFKAAALLIYVLQRVPITHAARRLVVNVTALFHDVRAFASRVKYNII